MYAIFRVSKVKSINALRRYDFHHAKENRHKLPLTYPERTKETRVIRSKQFSGCTGTMDAFKQFIDEHEITLRKNSCPCLEMFFGYSPEAEGVINFAAWKQANIDFIDKHFGGKQNIMSLVEEHEERTSHIHAMIVCSYEDKKGKAKVSANHFVDGPKGLRELQTEYAKAMEPFGLERGQEGSKAKHKSIAQWHREQEQAKEYEELRPMCSTQERKN